MTATQSRHTVLADADGVAYSSLRHRPVGRSERYDMGRGLRASTPRGCLGEWSAPADRPDPVAQIIESTAGRDERLVALRTRRMVASVSGFLRGNAALMAEDVAHLPATGIMPIVCGDAHLGNFGFYASPERDLVIDLNDFDEAHPGAWEWDLRRLVASVWLVGEHRGAGDQGCRDAVHSCVAAYRREVRHLAGESLLSRSYQRVDVDALLREAGGTKLGAEIRRAARRARGRTDDRALPKLTARVDGRRRIRAAPPETTHIPAADVEVLAAALDDYLLTLAPHWRRVLAGYTLVDIAHKVVGVGSVGLRSYIALLEGASADDVLFLQLKQARRSVLARHVHGDSAWHAHQGQRVVEYQQALQTVSDPLLGWTTTADGRQYYVRQFRNMKGGVDLATIAPRALADYAGIAGQLLAKGHARTSGASMIAGYVGGSAKLDTAMARFARRYVEQMKADHAALVAAVDSGLLPA